MNQFNVNPSDPSTPIGNREQLEQYLYVALQLEHATIPPYLTAAYSAKPEQNFAAIRVITNVAREEMLHLTLVGNLLNAIGGKPDLLREGFVPSYPGHLPDGETDFEVGIRAFSECAIETFLNIERPSRPPSATDQSERHGDLHYITKDNLVPDTRGRGRGMVPRVYPTGQSGDKAVELHFWSIGEFYKAILIGLEHLTETLGEKVLFCGDPARQINSKYFFSAAGDLSYINDLASAKAAIDLISIQGEGYTNETTGIENEPAHYYQFEQIHLKKRYRSGDMPHHPTGEEFPRSYSDVFPIRTNAKVADYQKYPEIEKHALLFNGRYRRFLATLNRAFDGDPDLFKRSYADMFQIKREMEFLIRNRLPGTEENAAPTFEMDKFIDPQQEHHA